MKRKIVIEIVTDDSGMFCNHFDCFVAGCWCDVFNLQTEKVPGTYKPMRPQVCLDAEKEFKALDKGKK